MNRIDAKFEQLRQKDEKALITFVTAGDPDMETTEQLILSMLASGTDLIEIGIPFSDPVAEGPVIQKASKRALDGGASLVKIFGMVGRLRQKTQAPLLMMMYLNSIFRFGVKRFFDLCAENGIDGVIVPDMPYEERDEIQAEADAHGVISIRLVAPTSHERIKMIAEGARGFLYCVSSTGVTGQRSNYSTDFDAFFDEIKKYSSIPSAVGFGISGHEQAKTMGTYCDGVIVGSAIVAMVEKNGRDSIKPVSDFVKSLKEALPGSKAPLV